MIKNLRKCLIFSYLYLMIDERAYELLCCQLSLANEEKTELRKQVNE